MTYKKEFMLLRDEIIEDCFSHLNSEQKAAVLSNGSAVLTSACPGAGKTQVIVNRIVYLTTFGDIYKSSITSGGICEKHINELIDYKNNKRKLPECLTKSSVPVSSIAVITFTKMAALNMRDRYIKISGSKAVPFFGTLHSLFYRILRRYNGSFGIISESQEYRTIKEVLDKYSDSVNADEIKAVVNEISNYKNKKLLSLSYETKTDFKVFLECFNAYENYKVQNNLLDFNDIIYDCIRLFETNKDILNTYQNKFRHILVDEFQDCDSEQIYMLQLLSNGNSIFAVGDEDQCIYGFRGSRPDCMVDFERYFKSGIKYFLSKNYRSSRNIIDISKNVINNNILRSIKEMKGVKEETGGISFLKFKSEMEQAGKLAELITAHKLKPGETAVLLRTNHESQKIISALIKNKIKFTLTDKNYNFFNLDICRDLTAYFRLSQNPCCRESFARVVNKPCRYVSKIKIEKMNSCFSSRNWFRFIMEFKDMQPWQLRKIYLFERNTMKMGKMAPLKALDYLLYKIGYNENVSEDKKDILNEFKDICSDFKTIPDLLHYIHVYENQLKAESNGESLIISTIHGAKGLEYKNVFIINCNSDNMPHLNSIYNVEEERRLFYVGITRAIDNLYLMYSETFKGNKTEISPFINECMQIKYTIK